MTSIEQSTSPGAHPTPRGRSSEPPMPFRQSMAGDDDSSPSRKRQRLDNAGHRNTRSLSADTSLAASAKHAGPQRIPLPTSPSHVTEEQTRPTSQSHPSQVTINIRPSNVDSNRSGHSMTQLSETSPRPPVNGSQDTPHQDQEMDASGIASPSRSSNRSVSPTVPLSSLDGGEDDVEIELVDEAEDEREPVGIQMEGDSLDLIQDIFNTFPYAGDYGMPKAAAMIGDHFAKCNRPINPAIFIQLRDWLASIVALYLQDNGPEWATLFQTHEDVLSEIHAMFFHLAARSMPLDIEEFPPEVLVRDVFVQYARFVAILVKVDLSTVLQALVDPSPRDRLYLASTPHLSLLRRLIGFYEHRPAARIWDAVQTDGAAASSNCEHVAKAFVGRQAGGAFVLVDYCQALMSLLVVSSHAGAPMAEAIQLLNDSLPFMNRDPESILAAFRSVDRELVALIEKPSTSTNMEVVRVLTTSSSFILKEVFTRDPRLTDDIFQDVVGHADDIPTADLSLILQYSWKFKQMKRFMMKGRMEARVACVDLMANDLVSIYNIFNGSVPGVEHPVLQYFAGFLLREQFLEYLIGVDSHPQLIHRSGNIIGFLVVTHRYTSNHTDLLWETITRSSDPRVISATISLVRNFTHLMSKETQLYVLDQLETLPLDGFTAEMRQFAHLLTEKIFLADYQDPLLAKPIRLCIRLLQEALPSADRNPLHRDVYNEIKAELSGLSARTSPQIRKPFYIESTCHIEDNDASASGSTAAILSMLSYTVDNDIIGGNYSEDEYSFLIDNLRLIEHTVQDICHFVDNIRNSAAIESPRPSNSCMALDARLSLFFALTKPCTGRSFGHLGDKFWDHLFGKDALSDTCRELAWDRLADFYMRQARRHQRHAFHDHFLEQYLPKLESQFYVSTLLKFVRATVSYCISTSISGSFADSESAEVPALSMLWHIILNAPTDEFWQEPAQLLASLHLDSRRVPFFTPSQFEDAQIRAINRCMEQLTSAHVALTATPTSPENPMNNLDSEPAKIRSERQLIRTLGFLTVLLDDAKNYPEFFIPSPKESPSVVSIESDMVQGNPTKISYQIHGDRKPSGVKSLMIGDLETLADLHLRLCQLSRSSNIMIIHRGIKVGQVWADSHETIRDAAIPSKGLVLIQKVAGIDVSARRNSTGQHSLLEQEMMKRFDELYNLLDSEDRYSAPVFDVLSRFSPHESIRQVVSQPNVDFNEIFPPGKAYKIRYSVLALRARLIDLHSQTVPDEVFTPFVDHGISLLGGAFSRDEMWSSLGDQNEHLSLTEILVDALLIFLKERRTDNDSACHFSNETKFVDQLCSTLSMSLTACHDWQLPSKIYSALLEASFHSRKVWEAFSQRQDVLSLHERLLLLDGRLALRHQVAKSIETALCVINPSPTLPRHEMSSFLWRMIEPIIPRTVQFASHPDYFFKVARLVFRNAEQVNQDESALRSFLAQWSSLLLEYRHDEFVGRYEVDEIVLGLTGMLKTCVTFLKSFKKPLNTGRLMDNLYTKFLFPHVDQDEDLDTALPVLEETTRRELYDLVLALCENIPCLERMSRLIDPRLGETFGQVSLYDANREIRAECGYVGLSNLSNTCYMNSLISQLFMNVEFREFITSRDIVDPEGSQRLLAELQRLFATMQDSFAKFARTDRFAESIQTPDNTGIDVAIQMDVDEFFNLLFDQCEEQVLSAEAKALFRSHYGGLTVNQIKSKECEHVSEREESYFAIQCDVHGKNNLEESLQAFIEGDVMEGDNKYKCESCGGRFVNAVKRTCLKEIPDNLIFHLKRFDFDLVHMLRSKINDYFSFPEELDISPYTVQQLDDPDKAVAEDIFELVGVLVHAGTAESGHYYSFIRVRPSTSGSQTWVEFNDTDVSESDFTKLGEHCFGGPINPPEYDQFQASQVKKSYNAYMLFYQRKSTLKSRRASSIAPSGLVSPVKVSTPESLRNEIARSNALRIWEHCLFDPTHPAFIRGVLQRLRSLNNGVCSDDHALERQIIEQIIKYIFHIFTRTRETPDLGQTIDVLRRAINPCNTCNYIALHACVQDEDGLFNNLLRTPQQAARREIGHLILDLLGRLRCDPGLYGIDVSETEYSLGQMSFSHSSGLLLACQSLVGLTRHLHITTTHRWWSDYFDILLRVANMGPHECASLLSCNALVACLHLLGLQSAQARNYSLNDQNLLRIMEKKKPSLNKLIELTAKLLSICNLRQAPLKDAIDGSERLTQQPVKMGGTSFPLTRDEDYILQRNDKSELGLVVIARAIELWQLPPANYPVPFPPGEIIQMVLNAEPELGMYDNLVDTLIEALRNIIPEWVETFIHAAQYFCTGRPLNADHSIQMMHLVCETIESPHNVSGAAQASFFFELLRHPQEKIRHHAFESMHRWAYELLVYQEMAIRRIVSHELRVQIQYFNPVQAALEASSTTAPSSGVTEAADSEADTGADSDVADTNTPTAMDLNPRGTLDWVPGPDHGVWCKSISELFHYLMLQVEQAYQAGNVPEQRVAQMFEVLDQCNVWAFHFGQALEAEEAKREELVDSDTSKGLAALGCKLHDIDQLLQKYSTRTAPLISNWRPQEEEVAVSEEWSEYASDSDDAIPDMP